MILREIEYLGFIIGECNIDNKRHCFYNRFRKILKDVLDKVVTKRKKTTISYYLESKHKTLLAEKNI